MTDDTLTLRHLRAVANPIKYHGTTDGPPLPVVRFSSAIMDSVLTGDYPMENWTIELKREFFISLSLALRATESIGWFEHTSDWDITLTFTLRTGETIEAYSAFNIETVEDPVLLEPALPQHQTATVLSVEKLNDDDVDDPPLRLKIEAITHLTVTRD